MKESIDLHVNSSIPNGYTMDGDLVKNLEGQYTAGTTVYKGGINGGSDVYLYKVAFTSPEQLYLTMGHEYVHVGHNLAFNGKAYKPFSEHAALSWEVQQARALGILGPNQTYNNPFLDKFFYDSEYHWLKFIPKGSPSKITVPYPPNIFH